MKIINPYFEIIEQDCSELVKMSAYREQQIAHLKTGIYKQIEKCGRTCYKSLDKITEDSCYGFVERMIKSDHTAMLEHGTVYLTVPNYVMLSNTDSCYVDQIKDNPHSKFVMKAGSMYITTNLRVINELSKLYDNNLMKRKWEEYLTTPTEYHEKRYTVKFVCNRQVSHEFVRHRVFSFAQESTRYCNYNKDKFGAELTFIKPIWTPDLGPDSYYDMTDPEYTMMKCFENVESTYMKLIERGWKPQEAATVLPNAIKTELLMTGFTSDWLHFFDLRALGTTGAPHPQAKELAEPLMNEFKNRGYIN